jgi:hypothetical protein
LNLLDNSTDQVLGTARQRETGSGTGQPRRKRDDSDGEIEAWHWTTAGKRLQLGTRQQWRKRLPERGGGEVEVEIGGRESYLDYRRRQESGTDGSFLGIICWRETE